MKRHKLLQLIKDNAQQRAEGARSIRTELSETEAHLYVFDVIDSWWGANATDLVAALAEVGDRTVHLHINSPGGDVFEARTMASTLVAHSGKVISHIDGLAASAATYLALAGNEVRMTEGGLFMVHNSWTMAWGNKAELRDTANLLEKIDHTISADYARRTGKTLADVVAWMDAETWFTAAEAKDVGFVDAVDANTKRESKDSATALAARWNLSAYARAPKLEAPPPDPDPSLNDSITRQLQINRNRLRLLQTA